MKKKMQQRATMTIKVHQGMYSLSGGGTSSLPMLPQDCTLKLPCRWSCWMPAKETLAFRYYRTSLLLAPPAKMHLQMT